MLALSPQSRTKGTDDLRPRATKWLNGNSQPDGSSLLFTVLAEGVVAGVGFEPLGDLRPRATKWLDGKSQHDSSLLLSSVSERSSGCGGWI